MTGHRSEAAKGRAHWPLERLCVIAGASRRTIERAFKVQTKMSFGRWRQQASLLHAIQMLAGGAKVTTVAMETGVTVARARLSRCGSVRPRTVLLDSPRSRRGRQWLASATLRRSPARLNAFSRAGEGQRRGALCRPRARWLAR